MVKQMTILFAMLATLIGVASTGRTDEKEPPKLYAVQVGDSFEVLSDLLVTGSPNDIEELAKAMKASDKEGEVQMLKDGTIEWLSKGTTVRVLEITKKTYIDAIAGRHKAPYAECRVIQNGRAVGKKYILLFFFNDTDMKPLKQ